MRVLRIAARIWTGLLLTCVSLLCVALLLRALAPLWPGIAATVTLTPPAGSEEVAPDSRLVLEFSRPMNRQTTHAAVSLTPAVAGSWRWDTDGRRLTFVPAEALPSNVTLRITVAAHAQSRWWQPLGTDLQYVLTTATRPTVAQVLPPRTGNADTAPFALRFDQPMIAETAAANSADTSALQLTPAVPLSARWLDSTTLLVTPLAPLAPATTYQLEVLPLLRDRRGIALNGTYRATFTTGWPTVLGRTPNQRVLSSTAPLTLTFAAPLELSTLRRALRVVPPTTVDLQLSDLAGTQLVTITARDGWQPATRYQLDWQLPAGQPADLPTWQFDVAAAPALVAVFPGSDQPVTPGSDIRLTFATPMDAATLSAGLTITPTVPPFELSVVGTGVRLRPQLAAATAYTITVAAGTPDRFGVPLAEEIVVPLRTGEGGAFAEWIGGPTLPLSTAQPAVVTLRHSNIPRVTMSLFRLDGASLVRAVEAQAGIGTFDPQRLALTPLLRWTLELSSERDRVTLTSLNLSEAAAVPALETGAYWLEADVGSAAPLERLLLISDQSLTLLANRNQIVVAAQDRSTDQALAGVPLTVYSGRTAIASGVTDVDGILSLSVTRQPGDALTVVSSGAQPAFVRLAADGDRPPRLFAALQQTTATPGTTVDVGGLALIAQEDGRLSPATDIDCSLSVIGLDRTLQREMRCTIDADGRLSAGLRLSTFVPAGDYRLRVAAGSSEAFLTLSVVDDTALHVNPELNADRSLTFRLTRNGRPAAGVSVDWTLQLTPTAAVEGDTVFGITAAPFEQRGTAVSDRFGVVLPTFDLPTSGGQLLYTAAVTLNDGSSTERRFSFNGNLPVGTERIGISDLPAFVAASEPFSVQLLTQTADRLPRSLSLNLDVRRSDGRLVFSRVVTSRDDGSATVGVPGLSAGSYRVTARRGTVSTALDLLVTAPTDATSDQFRLTADRSTYRVGEALRLAVSSPRRNARLLLTVSRGALRELHLFPVSNGSLIELPLGPALSPAIRLDGVLIADGERWSTGLDLHVAAADPTTTVTVNQPLGLPGRIVEAVITAERGLLLTLLLPDGAPLPEATALAGLPAALRSSGAGASASPTAAFDAARLLDVAVLRDSQTYAVRFALPDRPGRYWLASYLVTDDGRVERVVAPVSSELPLQVTLETPTALRDGDETLVRALVRGTTPGVSTAVLDIALQGAELLDAPRKTIRLSDDAVTELTWRIRARAGSRPISIAVRMPDGNITVARVTVERRPDSSALAAQTRLITGTTSLEMSPSSEVLLASSVTELLQTWHAEPPSAHLPTDRLVRELELVGLLIDRLAERADPELRQYHTDLLAELIARQSPDGGWGWWPGRPADPFVTLFSLEALIHADDTSLAPPRAFRWLAIHHTDLAPDLQAYHAALRRTIGENLTLPPVAALSDAGLAFALQAQATTSGDARLIALQRRISATEQPVSVSPALPTSAVSARALGIETLADSARTLDGPALAALLLADAGPAGPADSFAAVRIARALLLLTLPPPGSARLEFNGRIQPPLERNGTLHQTLGSGTLTITPSGLVLLAANSDDAPPVDAAYLPAWQLSAADGSAASADALQAGAVYTLEQLLLLPEPATRALLQLPLPDGLSVIGHSTDPQFTLRRTSSGVLVEAAALEAGVYRLRLTVRATAVGRFHVPPVELFLHQSAGAVSSPTPPLTVIRAP